MTKASISKLTSYALILPYVFICLITSGCAYFAKYKQSFLDGDNVEGQLHAERISVDDLDVHISIDNAVRLWETFIVVYVPVYLNLLDKEQDPPLIVRVGLLPKAAGYSFDPNKVYLRVNDDMEITPSNYTVLGRVFCAPGIHNDYEIENIGEDEYALEYLGYWHCFELTYNIQPPHPSQNIKIRISGLKKEGKENNMPDFSFKGREYEVGDTAP